MLFYACACIAKVPEVLLCLEVVYNVYVERPCPENSELDAYNERYPLWIKPASKKWCRCKSGCAQTPSLPVMGLRSLMR